MLRTVEFNAQPGVGAIEIQNVITHGMFPAEFEAGETMAAQCPPELLLLICLIAAKHAGGLFEAHGTRMLIVGRNSGPSPRPSPRLAGGGRGTARATIIY